MADTFKLEIATPTKLVLDEDVTSAEIPGSNGYLGILPGHAPLLGLLDAGVLTYTHEGKQNYLEVDSGFIEVLDNNVRVLAERADFAKTISLEAARKELADAQTAMDNPGPDANYEALVFGVKKAQARIDAAQKETPA
jgi:F-type H+-transporting ATPase subunit epsilon